jgi:hypothetical protein
VRAWPGLATLVMGEAIWQVGDQESMARRYDIRTLPGTTDNDAQRLNGVSRPRWERAHRVPWVLDIAVGAETNRTRTGDSGQHLACIRQLALHLL